MGKSPKFEWVTACLVVANTIYAGVEADQNEVGVGTVFFTINILFAILFTFEIGIRYVQDTLQSISFLLGLSLSGTRKPLLQTHSGSGMI